jgi:hypothetical protein
MDRQKRHYLHLFGLIHRFDQSLSRSYIGLPVIAQRHLASECALQGRYLAQHLLEDYRIIHCQSYQEHGKSVHRDYCVRAMLLAA